MSVLDLIQLSPKSNIGGIEIQATLEEQYSDALQITEHPVERGAAITDHAYKRPSEVVIRCGWSNSSTDSLVGAAQALFSGQMSMSDYVSDVYSQLLALQEKREPITITTSRRQYEDMLIVGLNVTTDVKTSNVLMVSVTLRQVIIVSTQATTLPPRTDQANPEDTAEIEQRGIVQPVPATPSPGGAVSPLGMLQQSVSPDLTSVGASNFFSVPALPTPQAFGLSLGGLDYKAVLSYAATDEGGWVLDMADAAGAPLVSGIPLVTGADLLGQFKHLGIPGGLWVQTANNPDAVPTFGNLGVDSFLFYVTK